MDHTKNPVGCQAARKGPSLVDSVRLAAVLLCCTAGGTRADWVGRPFSPNVANAVVILTTASTAPTRRGGSGVRSMFLKRRSMAELDDILVELLHEIGTPRGRA